MLNVLEDLIQQSDEWLEMRRTKIGASDAPVLVGVSPWKTPFELYEEKMGWKTSPQNDAMKRGLLLEEQARDRLGKIFGFSFKPAVCLHKSIKWIMASLDAVNLEENIIIEIKSPGKKDHQLALDGKIPDHYYPQLQHQMLVTDLKSAFYYSFDGDDGVIVPVKRDDDYIIDLLEKEKKFYDCLLTGIAPAFTSRDVIEREDAAFCEAASEWRLAKEALATAEKREERAREALIAITGNISAKGAGTKVTKIVKKGAVQYETIPELEGVNLDLYRKPPSISWRLS